MKNSCIYQDNMTDVVPVVFAVLTGFLFMAVVSNWAGPSQQELKPPMPPGDTLSMSERNNDEYFPGVGMIALPNQIILQHKRGIPTLGNRELEPRPAVVSKTTSKHCLRVEEPQETTESQDVLDALDSSDESEQVYRQEVGTRQLNGEFGYRLNVDTSEMFGGVFEDQSQQVQRTLVAPLVRRPIPSVPQNTVGACPAPK
jgi:hypothetical protein